ncbi:GMC family oxidoreductase [Brevibacillus fulvus]|uniref:Gluconate 2-dehydrogenase alpha chain n=1 Tax=Brevibacillus fulvus TaxID=1125967 RepID=A0A938Y2K8_9BACL|nr:GMC family oxidoreductase [Brevibacillus fulvus]MBM7590487.1 gluconate 2-dehydrogenase alpha chain [Brevibacillus fulvus]
MAKTLPKVDVVVVGVGWGGGIISSELTKAGLKVVGLEKGKPRTTADYFMSHDELRYSQRYESMADMANGRTVTFRHDMKKRALPYREWGSFLIGEGLGGSGMHWNGQTYRFLPEDFQLKSEIIKKYGEKKMPEGMQVEDWGITWDEIEPYFEKWEAMAGVSGEQDPHPAAVKRKKDYPNPPMKETPVTKMFKEAATKLGYHPYHMPSSNLSQQYTNPDGIARAACQYCAFCERFGCEFGAKADPVVTVIPVAQKTGNFELRTYSQVTRILHKDGKASGVLYVDLKTGEEFIQEADVVVVTTYVIENTRLLLLSKLGVPYDPTTGKGVVGRNYTYQVYLGNAYGFFDDKEFNLYAGAGALGAQIDDFNGLRFDHSDLNFLHGATIHITQLGDRPILNNHVPEGTPAWGEDFKKQSLKYANSTLVIKAQGASLPFRDNYLDLDPTYKDAVGDPLLRMTFNWKEQDRALSKFMGEKAAEIMKAMGANKVNQGGKNVKDYDIRNYQSTHMNGGTTMGNDPSMSVVNPWLQMWDAENVFVVGAGNFQHNSGYNPTATVAALAYRAAEGILKYREKGGSLV